MRLIVPLIALFPLLSVRADDLGPVHFTAPDGWQAANKPTPGGPETRLFVAPGSTPQQQAAIVMIVSPKSETKLDLRANFDLAVKGAVGNRKIAKASEVTTSKSGDGYDVVSQTVAATDDAGGGLLIASCVAVDVDNRLAAFCYVANDAPTFEKHQAAFGALLGGTRFGDKPQAPPQAATTVAAKGAPTTPAPAVTQQPPSLLPPEAVAKDQETRRKPGFVSGKVYDSSGRPFAMKGAKVEVSVFGTTFGGQKVGYRIAVDANGNYEMRVPDGLYRATCEAQIPFNGETLPLRLDCADGEAFDNDVNSADKGICKDWMLKLSGERAGGAERHGYNGWDFCAVDGAEANGWFSMRGDKAPRIALTLTPTSPLLDGSQGKVLEYRCDPRTLSTVNRWPGTPIANYRVTARLTYPDGSTRAGLITTDVTGKNQSDHVDVTFRRDRDMLGGSLVTPYVYVTDIPRR